MTEYKILPDTSSNDISQWMSDVEKEQAKAQVYLNDIDSKLADISIQITKLMLEKKELEPARIKAKQTLFNITQTYRMLNRNYFIQGKKGL